MSLRVWKGWLGGVLCGLWVTSVWGSEIVDRPGVGAKSYVETFDVVQEVDASAGLTPYLDESTVFNGALEQISYLSTSITVPFDPFPGAYDYDDSRIILENGAATLRPDPLWSSVLSTWSFEEAAWDGTAGEVSDGTGGASGTIQGQAQTTPGRVGRAAGFDGQGDAVVLGQGGGLALDPAQPFTLSAWFRTTGDGALIAKADSHFGARQFYLFVAGGKLWGAVGGSQHQGLASGVSDGQWHHGVLVNRNDDGVMRFTLYIDGVEDGTFDSGTASNSADVLLGARRDSGNTGLAFELDGELDEVAILDRALSGSEVLDLYAGGVGRALSPYPSDGPSITHQFGSRLFGVRDFRIFEATPSADHAGQLRFQVSIDGEIWQAWNGSTWAVVGDGTSNDAATVEAHLSDLDLTGGSYLYVRTFLLSDGTQPAGIDKLFWASDLDPVFEAREILGPVSADLALESLQAEITDTDGNYDLRLRLLEDDAETPVEEGFLPGNLSGFDVDDLAAPGVDLSSVPGGSYYVEAIFENPLGRYGGSARLEGLQVDYQESLGTAEIAVQWIAGTEPVQSGALVDWTVQVQNPSTQSLAEPSLELSLPGVLNVSAWTTPVGWTCHGLQCSALSLEAGATEDIQLSLQVGAVEMSQAVTVAVTADGLNDSDPSNNTAEIQLALDPAVQPRVQLIHQAEPADGTDVTYDFLAGPSVVLDDAVPDDGDGFGDQAEIFLESNRTYTLDPSLPVGWLLDDVQCSAPTLNQSFQEAFSVDSGMVYDGVAVDVSDGVARLRQDPLVEHLLAQWRFEEASWGGAAGEVEDSGGGGLAGSSLGGANTLVDGRVGRAATFDGQGDAVQLGQPSALDLDPSQPYTVSLWFRTLGNGALIAKADGNFNQRQFYLFVIDDRLWGTVGGSQHNGSSVGVSDGQWHHAALVNGGLGGPSTFTLYLDGQPDGTFSSGAASNSLDVLLGARRDQGNSGLAFQLDGELDEVTLLDRALTTEEVQSLYADGSGRLLGGYPEDGPSIDVMWSSVDPGWTAFTGFEDELGLGHEGQVTYQLSTDGGPWLWFDGAAWTPVQGEPTSGQSNDGMTVDANIPSLTYVAGQVLGVRAFLQSDGSQPVELDRLRILYTSDGLGGVSALNGASIDTTLSPDVTCQFSWITDPDRYGSFTLVQSANPADGTDFAYTTQVGGQQETVFLDAGDDGDGVASSRTWTEVDPGMVTVSLAGSEPGWYLDSITCEDPEGNLFRTPYDDPASYTYDGAAIEVSGGVARLRSDALAADLLGYWRMDEATWAATSVGDSSGLGLDASVLGQADTVSGLLGRAGSFDGQGDAVLIGQPSALDLAPHLDDFTVSAWFRTGGDGAIVGKAEDAFGSRQVYLFIAGGQVHANVGGVQNAGSGSFADNQWHHVVLVNDTSGVSAEHRLYVDGGLRGTFPSGSSTNGADWMVGARRQSGNLGTAFELSGQVDEVAIFNRVLDLDEVEGLYMGGEGRALGGYPSHGPSIVKHGGDSAPYLRPRSFTVLGDTDRLAFQLSGDGAMWQYWDGALWQPATDTSQHNDAATVDAQISHLETSSESIFVRAFLLSDGTQEVRLDEIQVGYDQLAGVSTEVSIYDGALSLDLQGGQNVQCTVHHVLDVAPSGSLSIVLGSTTPQAFNSSLTYPDGSVDEFILFDGQVPNDYTAESLVAGTYEIFSELPAGWERTDVACSSGPVGDQRFDIDYGSAGDFEFDGEQIEVTGGLARLKGDPLWPDLLAYWHLDAEIWSGAPDEVLDASGNGHHGMAVGGAATTDGLEGRAGDFDGSTGLVSFGRPPALDLQPASDSFTISAWFRTTGDGAIVGKAGGSLAQRQFYLFVLDGKLWSIVGGELNMSTGLPVTDGAWHHAVLVNYVAAGGTMRHTLYLDGKVSGDFASGGATNDADVLLGARRADDFNGGIAFQLAGQVDEVMIVGRALDSAEIELLAGEDGRHRAPFPNNAPAITQRSYMAGEVEEFIFHDELLGSSHAGEVAYQVDLGDGVWRYFDGVSLVPAGSDADRNSLLDLRRGLETLQPVSIRFRLKAFLISDGTQPVELDGVVLDYHHSLGPDVVVQGETVQVSLEPGEQASCYLFNATSLDFSSLTLRVDSVEADGTDYNFEIDGLGYNLDDAVPDDGDSVQDSLTFDFEGARTFNIFVSGSFESGLRTLQCLGNSFPIEYFPNTRDLQISVVAGENVVCDFGFERWFQRGANSEAITDAVFSANNFGAGSGGERLMTVAADDLSGDNPELDPEVFSYERSTDQWQRLTDNPMASSGRPDVSANDRWGVVPLDEDLTGLNPDGNAEVFRFDLAQQELVQVTDTAVCDTSDPAVSDDGSKVAFVEDCRFDGGTQTIAVADGLTQVDLPQALDCSSRLPKITADGSLVTFVSNCDWLGLNPDGGDEIFQWRWQDGPLAVEQWTNVDGSIGGYVSSHQVSDNGRYLMVWANDVLDPLHQDLYPRLRRLDRLTGERLDFFPIDDIPLPLNGAFDLPYLPLAMDGSGQHFAFYGYDYLQGPESPQWFWCEITEVGDRICNEFGAGDVVPNTPLGLLGRAHVTWDGAGTPAVYLLSAEDFDGSNSDGSEEIWRVTFQ